MQAADLLKIIQSPYNLSTTAVSELHKVLDTYPYFQLAYTLVAKNMYDQDPQKAIHAVYLASIYSSDRNQLKLLLENKLGCVNLVSSLTKEISDIDYAIVTTSADESIKVLLGPQSVDAGIVDVCVQNTAASVNSIECEQLHFIDNFIKKSPRRLKLSADKEFLLEFTGKDLTADDLYWHHTLLTETLAKIMLKQSKFGRAIEIYEKLKEKFPAKSMYFESLIKQTIISYEVDKKDKKL